ncbi:MAG: hypothetical protein M0026_18220 [Nocardiopsaceae bacterium]|nr:hypothetical protein [Nocardiopsaceae bacterium]
MGPTDATTTLISGAVDPRRFDDLAALLTGFGLAFRLERYGEDGELVRETDG